MPFWPRDVESVVLTVLSGTLHRTRDCGTVKPELASRVDIVGGRALGDVCDIAGGRALGDVIRKPPCLGLAFLHPHDTVACILPAEKHSLRTNLQTFHWVTF